MNDSHNVQEPSAGQRYDPAASPSSLTEPSLARRETNLTDPAGDQDGPADVSAAGSDTAFRGDNLPAEAGFYRPDGEDTGQADYAGYDMPAAGPALERQSIDWTSTGEDLQTHAGSWRARMLAIAIVLGVLVYLVTRDFVSAGAVIVAGTLFGFLGARRPRPLSYRIDAHGITIGQKHFPYDDFRAFSVGNEAVPVVTLVPLRRFLPLMSIHFDSDNDKIEDIIDMLADRLPVEEQRRDAIDRLVGKIKI